MEVDDEDDDDESEAEDDDEGGSDDEDDEDATLDGQQVGGPAVEPMVEEDGTDRRME